MSDSEEDQYYGGAEGGDFEDADFDPLSDYEWQQINKAMRWEMERNDCIWDAICEWVDNDVQLRNDKSEFRSCQEYVLCMLR